MSNPHDVRKLKRTLFAGRPETQPLAVYPAPLKRRFDIRAAYANPVFPGQPMQRERPPAATDGEKTAPLPPGAIPLNTGWLHTPVPLKWRPAVILQLAVKNSPSLAVPILGMS